MDQPARMLPNLAVSAAMHAAIAAAMIGYVANQETRVVRQETVVREELARSERAEAEQAQEEARTATRELVREQVRQDVLAQLSAQVQAERPLAKLAETADAAVQAELARIDAKTPLDAMDEAALDAAIDQLHDTAMAAAGEAIAATLKDELIERIRAYTEREAVPEVRRRIERTLADQVGGAVRKAAQEAVAKEVTGKDGKLVEAQRRAALAGAADRLTPLLTRMVEDMVIDEAVPRTTDALVKALAEPIARAGLQREAVEGEVRDTIRTALRDGLKQDAPEDEAALTQLKDAAQTSDPAAIAAAATQAAAAAAAMTDAAAKEEALAAKAQAAAEKQGAEREAASAALVAEAAAASASAQAAVATAGEAVQDATTATAQARDRRDQAAEKASDRRITDGAVAAQANLEHQAPQDAVHNARNAAREARQAADGLTQLAASLRSAAENAAKQQAAKSTATASAAAVEAASTAAGKALTDSLPAIADSAGKVDAGRLASAVDALSKGGSIAQLANLRERLAGKDADAVARSTTTVSSLTGAAASALAGGRSRGRGSGPATIDGSAVKKDAQHLRSTAEAKDDAWMARYNRAAYEAFTKDLLGRTDPANFYGAGAAQEALVPTTASAAATAPAASMFLDSAWRDERERLREEAYRFTADAKRAVPAPAFKTIAFAGAPLQDRPLTIDGDLSDWGPLRLPLTMRYGPYSSQPVEGGPQVFMRWSPAGLYFAYRVDMDPAEIVGNPEKPYDGDCLELFIDMENSRKENMRDTTASHQMCFTPFGFQGDRAKTLCEAGRGLRGIPFHTYQWRQDGGSAVKLDDTGYTVECFLPRMALAKRTLLPGQYLAVNLSVNRGLKSNKDKQWDLQRAWSASKEIGSWDKPVTWGDVLLLGSDADVAIVPLKGGGDDAVVPGQPVQVEVRDADMDLSPHVADRILGTVAVRGGAPMAVILGETGPATGVFRASFDTRSYILPPMANALAVRPGDVIEFSYIDARTAGGEKDRTASAILGVAYPLSVLAVK